MQTQSDKDQRKKTEVLAFLHEHVFDPILSSTAASNALKQGVRYTIMRLEERDPAGIVSYYWSAIVGTDRSVEFARQMRSEGFTRFEEIIDEFRDRFEGCWGRSSVSRIFRTKRKTEERPPLPRILPTQGQVEPFYQTGIYIL